MDKQHFDKLVEPEIELISLLDHNGIVYVKTPGEVRFTLADGSCKWETVCRYTNSGVLIYGLYPFETGADALKVINKTNKELTRGAMLLHDGSVVMRTDADLYDTYGAYEAIARALEYNAGAIVKYWRVFSSPAEALIDKYERPDLIIKNYKMSDRKEVGSADKTI